jgi:hypothetical protein
MDSECSCNWWPSWVSSLDNGIISKIVLWSWQSEERLFYMSNKCFIHPKNGMHHCLFMYLSVELYTDPHRSSAALDVLVDMEKCEIFRSLHLSLLSTYPKHIINGQMCFCLQDEVMWSIQKFPPIL